jgi:hypothetical protein
MKRAQGTTLTLNTHNKPHPPSARPTAPTPEYSKNQRALHADFYVVSTAAVMFIQIAMGMGRCWRRRWAIGEIKTNLRNKGVRVVSEPAFQAPR